MTYQRDFTKDELAARRNKLCDIIDEEGTILLQGADGGAGTGAFRQYNDFYYLCGVEVAHAYLAINTKSRKTTLFLPRSNQIDRQHNGPICCADDPDYTIEATGVDNVRGIEDLGNVIQHSSTIYTAMLQGEGKYDTIGQLKAWYRGVVSDPWDGRLDRSKHLVGLINARFPGKTIRDVGPIIRDMRLIKSPAEIDVCRHAGGLTARGVIEAMKATAPGVLEYQLGATMDYHYIAGGARGRGYGAIVAAGENAFYGHYSKNDSLMQDGDWVLVDCAPDYHYYTSDIGRMWPVNGTYTPTQRALYGFVVEYHKVLLNAIRPGRTLEEIRMEAADVMAGKIGDFKWASSVHEQAAHNMLEFRGHLSHSVGMSVHDGSGHYVRPLEPGIVFSVDPQMRIPEEKLYIRAEDTVVVTEDGIENFTVAAPLELDDVEAMMKEESILERFPPLSREESSASARKTVAAVTA